LYRKDPSSRHGFVKIQWSSIAEKKLHRKLSFKRAALEFLLLWKDATSVMMSYKHW